MMAKSMNAPFTGRIQKRKTNPLHHSHLRSIAPNTARVLRRRMSVAPRKRQSATKMRPVVKGQ